jgi:hypothetical protein
MYKFFRPYVFQDGCSLHQLRDECPDDGGNKHLWTPVSLYQAAQRNIPEDSRFQQALCFSNTATQMNPRGVAALKFVLVRFT